MEGIFIRKKASLWNVLHLLFGVALIALYVVVNIVDKERVDGLLTLLIMGILCLLTAIPGMLFNHGAYLCIEDHRIKAKYHWFGRLDCSIEDVEFVLPQINTLTILLKNGKRYAIGGLENSWALGGEIRKLCYKIEREAPASLQQKLAQAEDARKRAVWRMFGCIGLMFVNIFIAVLLTGGRDLNEFSRQDWILFSVMCFVELLTLIGLFFMAHRCGKWLIPIAQLKYRLCGAIIATHPLPTNNTTAVYTDANYTGRIVVCGFPNDESVYYQVQAFDEPYKLKNLHTSKIYDTAEELPKEKFSALINISSLMTIP